MIIHTLVLLSLSLTPAHNVRSRGGECDMMIMIMMMMIMMMMIMIMTPALNIRSRVGESPL